MGLYENSVGRGGNLLINIAPDNRGLLPEEDSSIIVEFGKKVEEKYSKPLDVIVEKEENSYIIKPVNGTLSVKTIVIKEDLSDGQGVEEFSINYNIYSWDLPLYEGKTIGHKLIFNVTPMFLDDVRFIKIKIEKCDGELTPLDIKVY